VVDNLSKVISKIVICMLLEMNFNKFICFLLSKLYFSLVEILSHFSFSQLVSNLDCLSLCQ